jgi:hypothetical protein
MIHWLMEKMGLSHCPECATLVDFAMDGLDDTQRGKVRQHLAECPPCMEQVRDFLQVNEGLGLATPQAECPEGFEQRVLQRLKQEGQAPLPRMMAPQPLGGWLMFWLRLGPVFAGLSLVMTFVAFAALWHSGASAGPSSELAQATEALLKDPGALHVALASMGAVPGGGELVLCRGKKNIYFSAEHLKPCRQGASYVLWMQAQGSPQVQRVAGFMVEADGRHFQLLQLPQALEAQGAVKFMVTQDDMGAKPAHSDPWLAGTVTL